MDKLIKKDQAKINKMMNELVRKDKPRDKKLKECKREHSKRKNRA